MLKAIRLLSVIIISAGLFACSDSHTRSAEKYFKSNIGNYGVFSDLGIKAVIDVARSKNDKEFTEFTQGEAKSCPKDEFLDYAEASYKAFNKVHTKILIEEIKKAFTKEELDEMAKFYSSFFNDRFIKRMQELSYKNSFDDATKQAATELGQDKIKEFVAYKNTPLGMKEQGFINSMAEKIYKHQEELKAAEKPKMPDCLKAA